MTRPMTLCCLLCALAFNCAPTARRGGPSGDAPPLSLDAGVLRRLEAAVTASIDAGEVPGAVVVIGNSTGTLYRKALGWQSLVPMRVPMTMETVFDLASLTKPVATAVSVMKLVDRGRLRVTDRVAQHIPPFGVAGKESVTVEHLLLHTSGLIADNALSDYDAGAGEAMRRIYELSPRSTPGERFEYSDVGYIVLGELVRVIDGRPLDRFATEEVFRPLGMGETTYHPPVGWVSRTAPTEQQMGKWLVGEVHDPRAAALGGVAGHAGLFSTADDLALFCRMILNEGGGVLSPATVAQMVQPRGTPSRTYGFDVDSPYSHCRGLRFPAGASFGHTGFTGTMFWIDSAHDLFVVLLTSRLQMAGGGATKQLRQIVSTYAAEAAIGVDEKRVLTGIDVLVQDDFAALQGRRIGLITNHTGVDRFGRRTLDLLHKAPGVELVSIFSPEHGIAGKLDEDGIGDARDEETGLPIFSLYGETRRPTPAMLQGIDTLVFDIQDIGTRFYTYTTTMGYAMEEAAKLGKRFVVLDRPNPIMPLGARGPLADEDKLSFIAYKPLPLTHGMTLGELARYFRGEYLPKLDLRVVEMKHYRREMTWEETGVAWVNPSPNMRSPTEALLYPAIGLLEMTNLSVGRGTDQPFERIGAPWIDGPALADALNGSHIAGLRFEPIKFTPETSKFAGERCGGVRIVVTGRELFDPPRAGLTIAWQLNRLYRDKFEHGPVLKMLANDGAHRGWQAAANAAEVRALPLDAPAAFVKGSRKYFLYEAKR